MATFFLSPADVVVCGETVAVLFGAEEIDTDVITVAVIK